jgi:hypothetical protein
MSGKRVMPIGAVNFCVWMLFNEAMEIVNTYSKHSPWLKEVWLDDQLVGTEVDIERAGLALSSFVKQISGVEQLLDSIESQLILAKRDDQQIKWAGIKGLTAHHVAVRFAASVAEVITRNVYAFSENQWEAVRSSLSQIEVGDETDLLDLLKAERLKLQGVPAPAPSTVAGPTELKIKPDGPFGTDGFRWHGTEYRGLTPKPFRLLSYLWQCKERTSPFSALAAPVCNDREEVVTGTTVGSWRKLLNGFFKDNSLPFKVVLSRDLVTLNESPA